MTGVQTCALPISWAGLLAAEGLADTVRTWPRGWSGRLRCADGLRAFDARTALLLPSSFEAAAAAVYWGARRRVGFATGGRRWLLTPPGVRQAPLSTPLTPTSPPPFFFFFFFFF